MLVYLSLFTLSLLSATLLPGGSEALLLYDISQHHNLIFLLFAASLGNTFGSIINYIIGCKGVDYMLSKERHLAKAEGYFQRYGVWALLLSWVPVIGDPITLVAGVLKYDLKRFIMIVLFAKTMRYLILVGLFV